MKEQAIASTVHKSQDPKKTSETSVGNVCGPRTHLIVMSGDLSGGETLVERDQNSE